MAGEARPDDPPDQNAPLVCLGGVVRLPGLYLWTGAALADREAIHRGPALEEVSEEAQGEGQHPALPGQPDPLARAAGPAQPTSVRVDRVLQLRPDQPSLQCHPLARGGAGPPFSLPPAQAARWGV